MFWFFSIHLLKKHTLNPEITILYQFHDQKNPFKVSKICNINFLIENDPPSFLALFRKFTWFASRTLPSVINDIVCEIIFYHFYSENTFLEYGGVSFLFFHVPPWPAGSLSSNHYTTTQHNNRLFPYNRCTRQSKLCGFWKGSWVTDLTMLTRMTGCTRLQLGCSWAATGLQLGCTEL